MPRALLVYNPNAGRFPPAEAARRAAGVLRAAGWEIDVQATLDADHLTRLAGQAAEEGLDAVIVAGGDGSIGRAVQGLVGTRTALAVLPTGTANVWAKELGLPRIGPAGLEGVLENARRIAGGQEAVVDVGYCNRAPFLMWAGYGLDALVIREAERRRSHLKKLFVLPEYFLRTLAVSRRWPGAEIDIRGVRADEAIQVVFSGRAQVVVATNIRRYAGGYAVISPGAAVDDGEMDLWVFTGRGAAAALRHARNLLRGSHVDDTEAIRLPFKRITIQSDRPAALHRDGEPAEETPRVEIAVQPGALRILAPAGWRRQAM